jgi:hypothetical protein
MGALSDGALRKLIVALGALGKDDIGRVLVR